MTDPVKRKLRNGDAAIRMRDIIAMHQLALTRDEILAHRFVCINLADGSSDNTVYDNRADAWRHHQYDIVQPAYVQIPLERWSEYTCDTLLWYTKAMYAAGNKPDGTHHLIVPHGYDAMMADVFNDGVIPL